MPGTASHGSQPSVGFDEVHQGFVVVPALMLSPEQDGGAGVLEALSTLLGPIGFFMIILLCVGVCIVYHNAK